MNARAMPRMSTPLFESEALVLDRDHRLLDDLRDLAGRDDHAVLLAEDAERVAEVVEQDRALRVLRAGRTCVSDGRSEATETNMPNTNETSPSSSTANRIARTRSRFRRGLGRSECRGDRRRSSAAAGQSHATGGRPRSRWRRETAMRGGAVGPLRGRESSIGPACRTPPTRPPRTLPSWPAGSPATPSTACPRGRSRTSSPAARGGAAAARQARHRPDGAGHPSRPRGRAAQAARVPGRRPPGGADRRRLHRARRRSLRALERCARCSPRRRSRPTRRPSRSRR